MKSRNPIVVVLFPLLLASTLLADNWPNWRGPFGNGVSRETKVPLQWGPDRNISWKALLGGRGVSGPVVWEETVFVTSQVGRGNLRDGTHPTLARGGQEVDEAPLEALDNLRDHGQVSFLVEAFHRSDGRRLWEYRIEAEGEFPEVHSKHNMASPSPVTDGERVYAWFATGQVVALDMNGNLVWKRHLGKEFSRFDINWGHGSSPSIYENLIYLLCYHRPASYLLALDKRTGNVRWKIDRGEGVLSHSTPFIAKRLEGDELIVNSSQSVDAYDPLSGEFLWQADEAVRYAIPSPSFGDEVLYMSRGYRSGPYMAIRTGGRGDVTQTHILWRMGSGAPYISSLLHYQGLVYMVNGLGVVTAVEALSGRRVWQERVGGIYSASPVAAAGRVYLLNESGETVVIRTGRKLDILARNSLNERVVASPAISDGRLFIRTDVHLICVGEQRD